jgi:hypothetical protein
MECGNMDVNRRKFLTVVGGAAGASVFSSSASGHANETHGGDGDGYVPLDSEYDPFFLENDDVLDNDELEQLLREIADGGDHVSLTKLGESTQGRPLWDIAVGNGSTNVMAIAQQHGDEFIMPEATIAAIDYLAQNDSQEVQQVRDALTLHLVPRVNPDGFVINQRESVDTDAPQAAGASIFGATLGIFAADNPFVGWDINRYHWADWTESDLYQNYPEKFPENPVKEARVLVEAVNEKVDPEWIIDYHRQGEYVVAEDAKFYPEYPDPAYEEKYEVGYDPERYPPDPDDPGGDNIVTSSLFWPANPDVSEETRDYSKQIAYTMYDAVTTSSDDDVDTVDAGHTPNVTWYPGGTYAGIARNAHGLQGRGSVLFELAAGTLGSRLYRVQHVAESLLALAKATADGSLSNVDPSNVQEIPGRGSGVVAEGEETEPYPE